MPRRMPATALSRRSLLGGAMLLAGVGGARAAIAPTQEAEASSFSPGATKPIGSWIAYEAELKARLGDSGGGCFETGFSRTLLDRVNTFRQTAGLGGYAWHDGLAACARAHAADMAARNYFGHVAPGGFTHLDRVALLNRDFCGRTSENLAWRDFPDGTTPEDIEAMWEQSPGHRRNLLRGNYNSVGYGVVRVDSAYYAAGVYADASVRLGQDLPLWIDGGLQINILIDTASTEIYTFTLTPPFQSPTWMTTPSNKMPALQHGAWQVRPLQKIDSGRFSVISGPLFFTG